MEEERFRLFASVKVLLQYKNATTVKVLHDQDFNFLNFPIYIHTVTVLENYFVIMHSYLYIKKTQLILLQHLRIHTTVQVWSG